MSDQMRILVVEDDEQLNQGIVNSLRKDGYLVQGVRSGAEAIRTVWSEEYDVVVGNLKTPGADGFELLQWLRTYRPKTRMIMVAGASSPEIRRQALEAGVVGYLEKPLDLHLLKEELRRLLQQTGFSASLDSFDLLDVIQIITMSRKNIALLINIGLEEHGILRFQGGELIWAEYGMLRGEAAFFALAAHKNGTVIHQPWNEQIAANVTQPLSRLIFQALQYRAKYATMQQPTGEQEAIKLPLLTEQVEDDDSPFIVLAEERGGIANSGNGDNSSNGSKGSYAGYGAYEPGSGAANGKYGSGNNGNSGGINIGGNGVGGSNNSKEWWQPSEKIPALNTTNGNHTNMADTSATPTAKRQTPLPPDASNGSNITPASVRKTPAGQRSDLPSWLTEQPTRSDIPMLRPSSLSSTAKVPSVPPQTPTPRSSPAEWQPVQPTQPPQAKTTGQLPRKQPTGPQKTLTKSSEMGNRRTGVPSPEWQPLEQTPGISRPGRTSDALSLDEQRRDSGPLDTTGKMGAQPSTKPSKRNYAALVAALQTLGYSIPGFIAAAVVSMDGQPIAQVSVDDLDISGMCSYFSHILQGVLQSLEHGKWGNYEDVVITSAERHILLRIVSDDKAAFQVLITSRVADPGESLEVMANVEGAIEAAL